MKINIEVTEDDIRLARGKTPVCENCPIARAISRAMNKRIIVNGRKWAVIPRFDSSEWKWYDLPGIAIHFIMQFDMHSRVEPINFEIIWEN